MRSPLLLLALLSAAAGANPDGAIDHARRGLDLMRANRPADSLAEWESALRLEPRNSVYLNFHGLALQATGQIAESRAEFRNALAQKQSYFDARSNLAYSLLDAGETKAAIPELTAALQLQPGDPELQLALAEAYYLEKLPRQSLTTLARIQKPGYRAIELKASALNQLGKRKEAQEVFEELARQNPDNDEALVAVTQIPLEERDWHRVLQLLDAGLAQRPDSWLMLFRRGVTYKLAGRRKEAAADFVRSVERGGDIALVSAALGETLAADGDLSSASEVFRDAFAKTGRPELRLAYSLALESQGELEAAMREAALAAAQLSASARAQYEYGKLLIKAGKTLEAKEVLERARSLDPTNAPALYALGRLYKQLGEANLSAVTMQEFLKQRGSKRPVEPLP